MKRFSCLIIVMMLAATSALSQGGKPPKGDTAATSVLADIDPIASEFYNLRSDGLGSYQNGTYSVSSIVQGIGNWVLDTKPSSLRRVFVDLSDPVSGTGANPPFLGANVPVRFISKCTTSIFTLALNQTILCPLAVSLDHGGSTYALRGAEPSAPGTDPVQWTCLARNSTKCISWRMIPSVVQTDGERKGKMQLFKIAARNNQLDTSLGQFYISFEVIVSTP